MTFSVGVLGFPLTAKVWGGISWATFRTVDALSREFPDDVFYIVLHEEPASEFGTATLQGLLDERENMTRVLVPKGKEAVSWCEDHNDVVWGPASGVLGSRRLPEVFTHHDMRMFGPLRESWGHYVRHRAGLSRAMRAAKVAVAVSPNTHREMLEHYNGIRYARMTCTIPWGVPAGFADPEGVEPLRPDFVEGGRFITAIYDPFPHKHMEMLERTVPLLEEHGWDLVVMGGMRGGGIDVVVDHPKVHYPGFVDYETMPRYIRASSLFLFPSEYEGFGFPPYEAMSLGVPVLYNSRCQALSDVVGDRAWSFSRDGDMVELLGRLMGSEEDRTRHVGEGREIAGSFDWGLTARRYMYTFHMAHAYKDRPLDFPSGDPKPPVQAID
jgi:glycosyltransferase involved in cell wall biosynthesis